LSGRPETPKTDEAPKLRGFDDFDLLLGDVMRGERATLGKSLLDVQRELKIKATYIAAIENADPSAFETPGFIAGYVRSYARYLGLDPEWAFKTFCDEGKFAVERGMGPGVGAARKKRSRSVDAARTAGGKVPAHLRDPFTDPNVSYLPKGEAALSGIEPRAVLSVAVLLVLLAGLGYGGWSVLQEVQKVRFAPVEQTPEVLAELDPLAAATQSADAPTAPGGVPAAEPDRFDRIYRPEALDLPVMAARDGPISTIDPNTMGTLAPLQDERPIAARTARPDGPSYLMPGAGGDSLASASSSGDTGSAVQVVAAAAPSVSLLAVRPSWVRVRDANGTVIFEKILDAGETFKVPLTEEPATLRAGNAGSLYFAVNGKTYGPAGNGPEVIKGVKLAPALLINDYQVADVQQDTDLARFVAVAEAQRAGEPSQ